MHQLATIAPGTAITPGATWGQYVRVTVRGYIATSLLGGARDSFPVSVGASDTRLRAAPSASSTVVASVKQGMAFHLVKRTGSWTQVERTGWMLHSALAPPAATASGTRSSAQPAAPKPVPGTTMRADSTPAPAVGAAPVTTPANADALTPLKSTGLSSAPGLPPIAALQRGVVLMPTARDRGWVRVQLEGWVREDDVSTADSTVDRLSAADLRANPDQYVGRTVRWTVTSLAFQTADPLRQDMKPNEPYLLARGPGAENALLYLTLPPELVDQAKALAPMAVLVVTARVRTGKSDPAGVPILDVMAMTTR